MMNITKNKLAKYFDHTFLKADATEKDMIKLCSEAKMINAAMVAINPYWVKFCKKQLHDTSVHVGAAIGFPLGQTPTCVKVFETKKAIDDGADEIDYVINISDLKENRWNDIEDEMTEIVKVCKEHHVISKVIFENCYLTKDEILKLSEISKRVKPDFIKTSTGFGTSGALKEDIELMKSIVKSDVQVKAAGGVRTLQSCLEMIEAGATRIGTSSSLSILEELSQGE